MDESFLDESISSYRKSSSPVSFNEEVDSKSPAAKNVPCIDSPPTEGKKLSFQVSLKIQKFNRFNTLQ